MFLSDVGVLDRVVWSLFHWLEAQSVRAHAVVLEIAPFNEVPVYIGGLSFCFWVEIIELVEPIGLEAPNTIERNRTIYTGGFV